MPDTLSTTPDWNTQLIHRYNIVGPRYTSYPTAPQLSDTFTELKLREALQQSNRNQTPLSLYFHIPFCDTVCYYCACNKIITANKNHARTYLQRLYKEMAMQSAIADSIYKETGSGRRIVEQLHWGGGTPTFLSDNQKRELMAQISNHFQLLYDDSGDYSIEVHPGRMNLETISVLRELGFNRLSMGVQDFDPQVQQSVNRFNSIEQVEKLITAARREQFHSISIDIIYGLPKQTLSSIKTTLAQIETFRSQGGQCIHLDPLACGREDDHMNTLLTKVSDILKSTPVLVYASGTPQSVQAVQEKLGREQAGALIEAAFAEIARQAVPLPQTNRLVVAGGETSGAVVSALGIAALQIGPEIDPGVPWTLALDTDGNIILPMALKSGNFGAMDFFCKTLKLESPA